MKQETSEYFVEQASKLDLSVALTMEKQLHSSRSPFQTIEVFHNKTFGNVLVLDGIVQLTEKDEANYHEMFVHVPLFAHESPEKVLLIGGGDGGCVTRILQHQVVQELVHVEIDKEVISVCTTFFPQFHNKQNEKKKHNSRYSLFIDDGIEFLRRGKKKSKQTKEEKFNVVIVDSSDPNSGPNDSLFTEEFYLLIHSMLDKQNGILVIQAENLFLHFELISSLKTKLLKFFGRVDYYSSFVPSYPGGQIGFLLCSVSPINDPKLKKRENKAIEENCRYYNSSIHSSSFLLPQFAQMLGRSKEEETKSKKRKLLT